MSETYKAKLFMDGNAQVVCLPADCCFEADEIYATRDDQTGDVVLSSSLGANVWHDFFELIRTIEIPDDFMKDRPMNKRPLTCKN